MPKFQSAAVHVAGSQRQYTPFREVCVPLYLPAIDAREECGAQAIDPEDQVVEAGGITIGDEDDDDVFY
jgi:hypothetical protein